MGEVFSWPITHGGAIAFFTRTCWPAPSSCGTGCTQNPRP